MASPLKSNADWWRGAVIYQVYPRSFQDTTGDGLGDLKGVTQRLPYIASLGVDAIWLSPFFTSPMADMGYDVSDYCDVDPMFGTLADFDAMLTTAHELGIKVIIDQVISHTSDQHPWFKESRSDRTNPKSDWYVWADPKPDGTAPNNWLSIFGGPAWEWDGVRKQYYMHNFLGSQPDLNFHNPDVQEALLETVRFWLKRGVDGFRLDTANFYFHDKELRDNPPLVYDEDAIGLDAPDVNPYGMQNHLYDKTQPENIGFLQRFRALLDEFGGRASVGEVGDGARSLKTVAAYTGGGDKLHMCYTFDLLGPDFTATHIRRCVASLSGRRHRWLGLLGLFQPRRYPSCQPFRADRGRTRAGRQAGDLGAGRPARLDLPLSGRGTGFAGGRTRIGGPARPLRHPLLAGFQGPRRMPHTDGLGKGGAPCRVFERQAMAAGARDAPRIGRRPTGNAAGVGSCPLSADAGLSKEARAASGWQHDFP